MASPTVHIKRGVAVSWTQGQKVHNKAHTQAVVRIEFDPRRLISLVVGVVQTINSSTCIWVQW
jgi:hypothetical protein